ncbi:phage-related exonuclease [Elysia marginata]|uniref:Phage-related exonuclease n=1 Tax=Elysia marginata TaxID=1093978 RepID=A0AAV4G4C3_9GAST|nr:phage-related exonuclease [Elysia marginata]
MKDWRDTIDANYTDELEDFYDNSSKKEEFYQKRLGKVTASNFGKLIVHDKKNGGYMLSKSQTAQTLIYKIAWERLLASGQISSGLGRLDVFSQSLAHGNTYESEAIDFYQKQTGREVKDSNMFIAHGDFIGGTPDGFVGEDGLIEVKCPFNGGNHIRVVLEKTVYNPEYIYQMQGYLWLTKRKWCDFVSYDPDMIDGLKMAIVRVQRDEELIEQIEQIIKMVIEKIEQITKEI